VGVDSGEVLVAHREVAKDSTDILTAVSGVSRRLRERIGESLRALEASAPLAEVTTPSLEALRKYSQGIRADDEGREDQGVRVLEEAVAIDTGFAMAWRKLGTMLSNQRVAQDRVIDAITRAHGLRARLTERERRLTEATYYSIVRGREDSAIISLERLLDQWPNDGWALNNIGVYLSRNGDSRGAVSYYRRSIVADPFNGSAYTNMMGAALQAGMADTAAAVAAEFERMLPGNADVPFIRASLALGRQEVDSGARLLEAGWAKSGADPRARRRWAYRLAGARQLQGRLAEGEELLQEVEGMARAAGDLDGQVDALAKRVYLIGRYSTQPERAAQVLADGEQRLGLSDQSPSVPYFVLAAAAARAGVIAKANRYLAASRAQLAATPTNVMRMEIDWAAGEAAAASGQDIEAVIDSIRALMPAPCLACPHASLGMLFDRLDQKDSALVHYRVFADAYEAGWQFGLYRIDRPYVYHRLGELYEWKGDRTRALEYYEKFVDLWKGADPELQPRVAAARKRIAQLIKEPQG
jgi:tetratricopeptide (TPR) repeat protein